MGTLPGVIRRNNVTDALRNGLDRLTTLAYGFADTEGDAWLAADRSSRLSFALTGGFAGGPIFLLNAFTRFTHQLGLDVVSDPFFVPPFHRQDR